MQKQPSLFHLLHKNLASFIDLNCLHSSNTYFEEACVGVVDV